MFALKRIGLDENDHALIRRFARQGDGEAFSVLMGRYADMVYTTCHRILGNETQAADAVQETFFQLAKDAKRIKGSLGGWLHKVATRRAVDVIRQNASRRQREETYVMDSVCRVCSWSEVEPAVDEALEELPGDLRDVLLLHFLQGQTTTQIAEAQGLSQPTVSRRMKEALDALRHHLRERGVEAGLAPLQAVLQHTNHIAPEALRYGLGKIALAKATLSGSAWAAWTSVPAGTGGAKLALASAAVVLAAGTTWVAHREFSRGPTPIAAQTSFSQPASKSVDSAMPQTGIGSALAQSAPASSSAQPEKADSPSLHAPRGFDFSSRHVSTPRQSRAAFLAPTNIQTAPTLNAKVVPTEKPPSAPSAGEALPDPETAAVASHAPMPEPGLESLVSNSQLSRIPRPMVPGVARRAPTFDRPVVSPEQAWFFSASDEAEARVQPGVRAATVLAQAPAPAGTILNAKDTVKPAAVRSPPPPLAPPRAPAQAQTR